MPPETLAHFHPSPSLKGGASPTVQVWLALAGRKRLGTFHCRVSPLHGQCNRAPLLFMKSGDRFFRFTCGRVKHGSSDVTAAAARFELELWNWKELPGSKVLSFPYSSLRPVLHRPAMLRFALGTALRSAARRQKTPPTCALQIRTPDQLRLSRQSIPSLSFSSAPDMPPSRKRQTADKGGEEAQVTKKPRGDTTGAAKGLSQGTDAEGNPYWEVCFAPSLRVLSSRRIRSPFPTDWQQPAGQFVPVQGRHAGEHPRILHRARWRAETGKEGREPKK